MPAFAEQSRNAIHRLGRSLADLARSFASRALFYDISPEASVDAEIGLTLEHLERQRALETALLKQLLVAECAMDSLILPRYGYHDHSPQLKAWVRDRLLAIERERREIVVEGERQVAELELKLLQLVGQRRMLQENGEHNRR